MKKIIIIQILALCSLVAVAQEKGSYLTISGGMGAMGLKYDLKGISSDGENKLKLGANAMIGYSYYFTRHWGLGTGLGFSYYQSVGRYNNGFTANDYFNLGMQMDDDNVSGYPRQYELRARLANWEEKQSVYLFDIPLMVQFQHKFGERELIGLYAGVGAKVQLPFRSKFKVQDAEYASDGRLNVSGFYSYSGIDYASPVYPALTYHSFGTIHNPNDQLGWNGDIDLKASISGIAELGMLVTLTRRLDLTLGAFLEYGFNDVKKGDSSPLMQAPAQYLPDANNNIGNGITYAGVVNSDRVDNAHLLGYGGKIGLRIKLGKVREKETREDVSMLPAIIYRDTCCSKLNTDSIETLLRSILDSMPKSNEQVVVAAASRKLPAEDENILMERIYFDLNSSVLRQASKVTLDNIYQVLTKYPDMDLKLYGNTCDLADDRINIPLGMRRAESAKKYLVDKGINPRRLTTFTQSSYDPLKPNTNETNRSQNRRVEFVPE